MNKAQKWLSFFALSMTGGIIFQVAYIRFVYLEPTYTALNLSSQQYGNIISAFGAVAIVMYFFGGWFSDKFSPKLLIVISLAGMGIADLYLATVPGFWGIVAAHILMAVVGMGLYWSALVKSISMLGDSDEQAGSSASLKAPAASSRRPSASSAPRSSPPPSCPRTASSR